MKKIISISLVCLCFVLSVRAQQTPLYTQIYFMRMLYNPAFAAYNSSTNLYGFYREQWTNMPGHPVTRGAMGEISLWKDRSGVGFHVYNDNTDIIQRVNAQLYYAQKIRLAKNHLLSLGVSTGVLNTQIDFNNARVVDLDDAKILQAARAGAAFDMSVGLGYQWKKLTVGLSIPRVVGSSVSIENQLKQVSLMNQRHFVGSLSYEISTKQEKFNIEPSVIFKKGFNTQPIQVDANVVANYKRSAYLGVGYRMDNGLNLMTAVRISRTVLLGYSYDFPLLNKTNYAITRGTHEVIVGLCFDRWLKKADREKELEQRVQKLEAVQKQNRARIDSLEQQNSEQEEFQRQQQEKIKELQDRIDSLQQDLDEYNKRVSEKNVTRFNDKAGMEVGDIYRLDQVYFDFNKSTLKPESYVQLDRLVAAIKEKKITRLNIYGHTDFIASDEYNQWLSERRAKSVVDYLVSKGVNPAYLNPKGFGKRAPIADNSTEEGRAKNRRVEIDVVKVDK